MKLSPISNTRTADPRSRGAEEESLYRRPTSQKRLKPFSALRPAGAIGVSDKRRKFTPNRPPPT